MGTPAFTSFNTPNDLLFTETASFHDASPLAVLYPEKLTFSWTNFGEQVRPIDLGAKPD